MRRYIPALLLLSSPFAIASIAGCDMLNKLKGGGDDAGTDAAIVPVTTAAPAGEAGAAAVPTTATTTTALPTTPTPVVKTVVKTDGGVVVDAGAPVVDAGKAADGGPAPAPTPTFKLPGFDAGGLKFDAGGLKLPWKQ